MRKSKVLGISLPPKIYQQLEKLTKTTHKNRSQLIKDLITAYSNSLKHVTQEARSNRELLDLDHTDISQLLSAYYQLKSQQPTETIVVGLGIISQNSRVLIGKRIHPDPHVTHLTWVFPGGRLNSLELEKDLKTHIQKETGLTVQVVKLVHARIHPDNLDDSVSIVALYFHCQVISGKAQPSGFPDSHPLVELKWVKPLEVCRYFTTSTADQVINFLKTLEYSSPQN